MGVLDGITLRRGQKSVERTLKKREPVIMFGTGQRVGRERALNVRLGEFSKKVSIIVFRA